MDACLAALRIALDTYIGALRETWAGGTDLGPLFDAVALEPSVDGEAQREFRESVAAGRVGGPLGVLAERLGLDDGELLTVAATWWAETDPQFATVLGCAHDDGGRRYPSAALLRLVLAPFGIGTPPAWEDADPLVRCGVLEPGSGPGGPLRLTPTARRHLAGRAPQDRRAALPPERHVPLVAGIARWLSSQGGALVLRGPRGSGLEAVACAAVREAGAVPVCEPVAGAQLRLLARLGTGVPVVPATELADLRWSTVDGPLLAWGLPGDPAGDAYPVEVPGPTPAQRIACWRTELAAIGVADDELAGTLGSRFPLPEQDIASAVARAAVTAAIQARPVTPADVWLAARRRPEHELSRVATMVVPGFTLDDLVVAADTRAQLDELVAQVALRDVVFDRWGFRARMPRGQGVAALFTGPPGTGKTMAAEALAAELGQDLYRVDLSAVVSKYLGETEKNLALAFDEAERAAAVLFFDECDALFGKRTEQHDAHDRWANLEVNYLLQRVETFTGLVLLATNKRAALDEAFLRRLRFDIRFDPPDAALRRTLWSRSFPEPTPRAEEEWDLDALADHELAGGHIQASALAAAFLAAADGGRVRQAHVLHALRREYDKLGKAWR